MSGITHAKVSAKSDGADPSQVLPSDWNADHVVTEINIAAGGDAAPTVSTTAGTYIWGQLAEFTNNAATPLDPTSSASEGDIWVDA